MEANMQADARTGVPATFFGEVRRARRRALLLDYDGTLAPFAADPAAAEPYPGVRELLEEVAAAGSTRLALVTGRSARQLAALLRLRRTPEIWGCHGAERLTVEGAYFVAAPDAAAARQLVAAALWARALDVPGVRVEPKATCLALHWRGLPPERIAVVRARVNERWQPGPRGGLVVAEFDGGIELRAPGRDKGAVVDAVLAEVGAPATVAYLGDDLTDEAAFTALAGRGLSVLVRPELRPTAARCWLRPPVELLDFLGRWLEAARLGAEGCDVA
jgi:trehalose 6-phosphate phosphatase